MSDDTTRGEAPPEGSAERRVHDVIDDLGNGRIKPYWRGEMRKALDVI